MEEQIAGSYVILFFIVGVVIAITVYFIARDVEKDIDDFKKEINDALEEKNKK